MKRRMILAVTVLLAIAAILLSAAGHRLVAYVIRTRCPLSHDEPAVCNTTQSLRKEPLFLK